MADMKTKTEAPRRILMPRGRYDEISEVWIAGAAS
jgi:hypothetical protein